MKALFASATLVVGLMASAGVFAKANEAVAPAGTPAGTTGMCNDGSMNRTATKNGACNGHKGIKVWYTTGAVASVAAPEVAAKTTLSTTTTTATPTKTTMPTTAAAGGGSGQVWVNTASKVYHCQGSKYYGKTKAGQYMTEAAAQAAGAHGKACH